MSIICRPAEPEDIPRAVAIRALASSEVRKKYGYGSKRKEEAFTPDSFYAFSVEHEPEGFWVAEEGDHIVGMMISWVRGAFWFLSYLFVAPEYQDRKVGRYLLDAAMQNGSSDKVSNRALVTYAYNTASIGLYMKCNMFSREPVYKMVGSTHFIRSRDPKNLPVEATQIGQSKESFKTLSSIDRRVLGFSRGRHHEFFLQRTDGSGYLVKKSGDVLGYAYIWDDGQIGPLAVSAEENFAVVLEASLSLVASKNTDQVSLLVPGSNTLAVTTALKHKFRVREPYILMATNPFGTWSQYLFHSPPLL